MTHSNPDWVALGLCSQPNSPVSPDVFHADTAEERREAKKVCAVCPVRLQCLTDALGRGETHGVWGGCDEVDLRRALWAGTPGTNRDRVRYPRCPACRARTEHLFISSVCDLKNGMTMDAVECGACRFSWTAPASVGAMKKFWEEQKDLASVTPIKAAKPRRKTSSRRGKIPSGVPVRDQRVLSLSGPSAAPTGSLQALVAASGVTQQS